MAICLIGIGSNLGDREATLRHAVDLIGEIGPHRSQVASSRVVAKSRYYENDSIGGPPNQPAFLNGALLVETSLSPLNLLRRLLAIETQLGRTRGEHWAARTLDLDLLLYNSEIVETPELTLPHPRMAVRRFVLEPAAEIGPELVHPTIRWTISQLLEHLQNAKPYVALAGAIGVGKTALTHQIGKTFGANTILEPIRDASLRTYYANPAACAWETETALLGERVALVAQSKIEQTLAVSDFWIEQSLAFASLFLPDCEQVRFAKSYEAATADLQPPKLLVVLDAPTEVLIARIKERGRPYEGALDAEWLERLRVAIAHTAAREKIGPTLWLDATDVEKVHQEVFAAIRAMT